MASRTLTFTRLLAVSTALRVALIFYSEWHDARSVVKYTDVDYRVFSDAARFLLRPTPAHGSKPANVAQGPLGRWLAIGDPYTRATYRYTPLLAALLTPNIWLHPSFGKYLFSACDILVGILLRKLLISTVLVSSNADSRQDDAEQVHTASPADQDTLERKATLYTSLHLLNPLVFSISTRGSSESTLGALVVGTLYFALNRRWDAAAVMLGLSTHWKIYPVIYATSLVTVMSADSPAVAQNRNRGAGWCMTWYRKLVNRATVRFALISGGTFMLLNLAMYIIWGYPFLYETYLYHLHRLDHRHNFSPYFLPIYLRFADEATAQPSPAPLWRRIARSPLTSFAPQMTLALGTGVLFARARAHLPFAWFVQTAVFVTFNRVCTSQYFLWYLTLLPLVLPSLSLSRPRAAALVAVWACAQAMWLKTAYALEFLGESVFFELWVWSVVFLLVNCWVLGEIMNAYCRIDERPRAAAKKTR